MNYPPLEHVECALLHDEFKPLKAELVSHAIQTIAQELKYAPEVQIMPGSNEHNVFIHAGGHRILVSQRNEPLGPAGFRNALTTPYTGMILPDAHDIVQKHCANTFITIAKGVMSIPDEAGSLKGLIADTGINSFNTIEEMNRAREFCRLLTNVLLRNNPATAVHWCVSDNLISQAFYEFASNKDMNLLNVRPFLSSSAGRMGEGLPLGAVFNGSQWIIGKMINFDEAKVPFNWMMEVVMGFIRMCQVRGSIIPHNETFSVEGQDWTVAVFHEPARDGAVWEHVRLKVVNAAQFGIHGDTSAKRTYHYDTNEEMKARAEAEKREIHAANDVAPNEPGRLDPEDDFDLAIIQKLNRQKHLDVGSDEVPEEFAAMANDQPAWETPARRNDIDALRNIAKQSLSDQGAQEANSNEPRKTMLGKVSGLFSRK